MKKLKSLLVFSIFISLVNLLSMACAAAIPNDIGTNFGKKDYNRVIKLFEEQVEGETNQTQPVSQSRSHKLFLLRLSLGHVYAWKLNKFDSALLDYQKATEIRQAAQQDNGFILPCEYLFIANIHEQNKDYETSLTYYQKALDAVNEWTEKKPDGLSVIIGRELACFVQYQIDGINRKIIPVKNFRQLLPKLNLLYSAQPQALSFLVPIMVPTYMYECIQAENLDLRARIQKGPPNIYSMLVEYMMVMNASAGLMNADVESAIAAFLDKYTDSYFSLPLRYLLVCYYKENKADEKAKRYRKELKNLGVRRKMELIIDPDKKFSTPELTWKTYRKALSEGDISSAIACHSPDDTNYGKRLLMLGADQVKKMGADMREIEKIKTNDGETKYLIKQNQGGRELTYDIHFVNIKGEWKIRKY